MTDTTTTNDVKDIDYQTDRYLVRQYVSRILTRFPRYRDDARWTELRGDDLFGSPLLDLPVELGHRCRGLWHGGVEREDVPPLRRLIAKIEEECGRTPCPEGILRRNLLALAHELKLPDEALEVLTFQLAAALYEPVQALVGRGDLAPSEKLLLIAAATVMSPDAVRTLLSGGSPLVEAGLLEADGCGPRGLPEVGLPERLKKALTSPHAEPGDVLSFAARRDRLPALPLEAFNHLKPWPEVARRCLVAADSRGRGLNVLVHGPGGAGKTTLARSLARAARLELFSPPQEESPGPYKNYDSIQLAFAVLRRRGHGALLMDPGFFASERKPTVGCPELHFLLDHPGVQVLWTAPTPDALHPDFLRRFDLVLALPEPAEPWTRPVWEDLLTPDERASLGIL